MYQIPTATDNEILRMSQGLPVSIKTAPKPKRITFQRKCYDCGRFIKPGNPLCWDCNEARFDADQSDEERNGTVGYR